jgi:redox-sensitive bicupin YhaK (pirin superfamily)
MLTIRKAGERGHFDFGWLDTHHTFSFGEYHDPHHMGFRTLRVINEDVVRGGRGFGTHPHRDMEIVTYVLSGALAHQDSMGNGSVIRPNDVQRMSAGTGVTHSEHNASRDEPVHLLQIWLLPAKTGTPPSYEQRAFPTADKRGRLKLVGASDGRDGAVTIHQDVALYASVLDPGSACSTRSHRASRLGAGRARRVTVNGQRSDAATARASATSPRSSASPRTQSELLLFDLA